MLGTCDSRNFLSSPFCGNGGSDARGPPNLSKHRSQKRGYKARMNDRKRKILAAWLKDALDEAKMTGAELLRRLDAAGFTTLSADKLSKSLKATRDLSYEEVANIATLLRVRPPLLPKPDAPEIAYVNVRGEVQAGMWQDTMHVDSFPRFDVAYAPDPDTPKDGLFALVVRGDSINRQAPDGSFVICLDAWKAPREYQDGDWVVVRRTRGELQETTVKRVSVQGGRTLLVPDSTDPRFTPLVPGEGEPDEVAVIAFVIDFLRPATRF